MQTDRQTSIHIHTDILTEGKQAFEIVKQTDGHMSQRAEMRVDALTDCDRQTPRGTVKTIIAQDRQTNSPGDYRHIDRQTDRQIDRPTPRELSKLL